MERQNINDLMVFLVVARERSFTKAAAKFGVSQSALSHTLRQLEQRLGVRLLTRTTRSVSPTEAGERMLQSIGPLFDEIGSALDGLNILRDQPAGTVRLTAGDYQIQCYIWPKLRTFLQQYPDIRLELDVNYGLQDIVSEGYDAGVRFGEQIAKDMISVRIGPDVRFAVVAAESYFALRDIPTHPKDLMQHRCINLRLPTYGGLYAWEFEENGREIKIRVDGQLVFNTIYNVLEAALDGFGFAYVPEDIAKLHLGTGRLHRFLEDFSPYWEGFHLYYPSRRQSSPAFSLLVNALRYST
ncbi:LysR family transcriptional regulator [Rhizobium leguminosarum]|uniref:LysR family transcriptional regulator n=1 Tax=Rhizobium leguminosarum TaxID=384 RepID=UPI000DE41954|nr:LysR family transcriptional regulator [Rhizobium leguminosarum]MBY2912561.1 LysR family transcriptional regulator [Rhizobium leguminosarum]MBY2968218.1 LysR family transcriptional regulator [Rhizobium leguminosarum]MBY2975593.1 LysR family transcriptional regulator [Rhizobium leguminosarum]MBY2997083.1 LysR family transcriptional regulator [Rhizobium leguminosarum]MBY3004143.1 LysR family transcriptional regulator [Rhizobium leguminosarum]